MIDLSEIEEQRLITMASQAWMERKNRSALLAERMPEVSAESGKTMAWIAQAEKRDGKAR